MDTVESKPNRRRRRRPLTARSTAGLDWFRDALLGVVVVGSVLAIGTVHIPVLLVVTALAIVGGAVEMPMMRRVPRPALVLAGLGLFSAIQAIPMPAAWVRRVSPATADVWLRCLEPLGEPSLRWFPLSLDTGASIAEALKWFSYACVYIMAARMRLRRGSAWLAVLLFGSASLVTLITLSHGLIDLGLVYGFYHPSFAVGRWSVGPLLNSNNLGGYAILGVFCGLGLLLSERSPVPRTPIAIGLGAISAALCLSGSRGAVVSALAAGAVTLAWLGKGKGARVSPRSIALGVAPFLIGILIAAALGTARDASALTSLDVRRKLSVWLWCLPMIRDHVLFGAGRGAFETAFSPYRHALDYDWATVVSHAENFVVQWVAEWGVPVGLSAVVATGVYVLREWRASRSDRLRFMVMTGLLALLVQNLADLGLEIPALALAAVVALAAGERPATASNGESKGRFGGVRVMATVAPGLALWVATVAYARLPVELERREMSARYRELSIQSPEARARFRSDLRAAVLRHPGEAFFPLLGSLDAMRAHDRSALSWIARALELGPMNGPVHLALAELLHDHGATVQAMLHLRLAAQYDRTLLGAVAARASRWAPSIELLMQAIPEGPERENISQVVCASVRRMPLRVDCFRRASLAYFESPQAQQSLAEVLLFAAQTGQPPCAGELLAHCLSEAEAVIQAAEKLDPKSWHLPHLMAKVLLARGDAPGAARLLSGICPPTAEGDDCWHDALTAALKSGSSEAISIAANGAATRPCDGMEACGNMFASLATTLDSAGQTALASTFFTRAAEADSSAVRWLKVAECATRAGIYGVARVALERAERSPDASLSTRADAERVRQQLARAADRPL